VSGDGLLSTDRVAQPGEGVIADAVEGEREQRVGELQRSLERQVGVVDDPRSAV
jgi:hypothetical protein